MLECLTSITAFLLLFFCTSVRAKIDRKSIVQQFNLHLSTSHPYSPLQVGNGNFAFGVDVTGLQTFVPHNTLSSWGWHNDSLPTTSDRTATTTLIASNQTLTEPKGFTGVELWTHDRLVNYEQPNEREQEKEIGQWLIANPHRINLGRVGLWFGNDNVVTEEMLKGKSQVLDLWEGRIESRFDVGGEAVEITTVASPRADTIAVEVRSNLLGKDRLGIFLDFPYASGENKFDAPFVGVWDEASRHETFLETAKNGATIKHALDSTVYSAHIEWEGGARIEKESEDGHRYILKPSDKVADGFRFTVNFAEKSTPERSPSMVEVREEAKRWWQDYWENGAFISLPITTNSSAKELQRRIILSQYLLAVNGAGKDPAQESGLVNNGWYGKFHLEMVFWHLAHWTIWNKWSLYDRAIGIYNRFLPSSIERAKNQGYEGARLGKMCDPSGRSAPGQINSLLIWQQPHPMYFAEMEYRKFPTAKTLQKWDNVLTNFADFMASYAWFNSTTKVYDLGPPLHLVSENTNPNETKNPPFELAYWDFGLSIASNWKLRQKKPVPPKWTTVRQNLAPFPIQEGLYVLHESVKNPWTTPKLTRDHPSLLALNGFLPPSPLLNRTIFENTLDKVYATFNFTYSYGWDFPLLAMTAARRGRGEEAVGWLLNGEFVFDEVGMPVGGVRVKTPYFPSSGGLLAVVGMMVAGWDGREGMVFPEGWVVEGEGFQKAL
ncbi:Six-hairpin glycosidase-like protein [Venturia nashicola]|uniref:Six-hairpin glycosidase-like protein n=1 Tax=Venturia nashicola TaxID=86259 RepID=A0A4Z1PD54_9PEZI|nr:Six-hairpin glycosidase-like protein [Venturia nashicola]